MNHTTTNRNYKGPDFIIERATHKRNDGIVRRVRRKEYPNGDVYVGEMSTLDKRDGYGKLSYVSGSRYEGEFSNNFFHGFGVFTWAPFRDKDGRWVKGRRYEGHFVRGRREGEGVYFTDEGDSFEGTFERGRLRNSSNSKIVFANGDRYSGGVKHGKFEGNGRYDYQKKNEHKPGGAGWYSGQYKRGEKNGTGVRVFMDGTRYIGDFSEGWMEGDGVIEYSNGNKYVGSFRNGKFDGNGEFVFTAYNGDKCHYVGGFRQGSFYGKGVLTYPDGGFYNGEFKASQSSTRYPYGMNFPTPDSLWHGFGTRVWASGNCYEGEWERGKMKKGTLVSKATGSTYYGDFVNNLKDGFGKETWKRSGDKHYFSPFLHDPCVAWVCSKKDLPAYAQNATALCAYEGEYKSGFFHGKGNIVFTDDRYYKGEWNMGKRHGIGECILIPSSQKRDHRNWYVSGALPRGFKYNGEWCGGHRHGRGSMTFLNGGKIEGNFRFGLPHGEMTFKGPKKIKKVGESVLINMEIKTGFFENGNLVGRWIKKKEHSL